MTELSTYEEMNVLGNGAVVLDVNGEARQRWGDKWHHCGGGLSCFTDEVMEFGPFQLLKLEVDDSALRAAVKSGGTISTMRKVAENVRQGDMPSPTCWTVSDWMDRVADALEAEDA